MSGKEEKSSLKMINSRVVFFFGSVPYSGTYLFSVHGLPILGNPFRLQLHRNGDAVAEMSNGQRESQNYRKGK